MDSSRLCLIWSVMLYSVLWRMVDSRCNLPNDLQNTQFQMVYVKNSTGESSRASHGWRMTTYNSTIDGIAVTVHGEPINQWVCLFNESSNYVLKGSSVVDIGGYDYYVYFGFQFLEPCVIYNNTRYCLIKPLCDEYSSASDEQLKVIPQRNGDPTSISEIQGNSVPDAYYFLLSAGEITILLKDLTNMKKVDNLYQKLKEHTTPSPLHGCQICKIVCPCLAVAVIVVVVVDIALRTHQIRKQKKRKEYLPTRDTEQEIPLK